MTNTTRDIKGIGMKSVGKAPVGDKFYIDSC